MYPVNKTIKVVIVGGNGINDIFIVVIKTVMCCYRVCEIVVCYVCRFIYEMEQFNGIGELLEILGRLVSSLSMLVIHRYI